MRLRMAWFAAGLMATISASKVEAQACEWDGERTICPTNPQTGSDSGSLPFGVHPGWLSDLFRSHPKPRDEAFERSLAQYESHLGLIFENSRSLDRAGVFAKPRSRDELSRRIDQVLSAVWPEYTAELQEYDLLRRQSGFFAQDNPRREASVASTRSRLEQVQGELPGLRARSSNLERALAEARSREAELSSLALRLLNDRRSENHAIATLLVYAYAPGVAVSDLDPRAAITAVPGTTTEFYPPGIAIAADSAPNVVPTRYAELTIARPSADAPVDQKLSFMQVVGRDLQTMFFNLPPLRKEVAAAKVENDSLKREEAGLLAQLTPLAGEEYDLQRKLTEDEVYLAGSQANSVVDAKTIFREVLADMALDAASNKIQAIVEAHTHVEGSASANLPNSGADALLEAARHGTKFLLPNVGYQQQWDSLLQLQSQAWDVLGRNQRFMLDAAHLLGTGNAAEAESYAEKVFATAKWQSFEMVKTVGMGEVPEGEDKPLVESIFDKTLDRLKQHQTGER